MWGSKYRSLLRGVDNLNIKWVNLNTRENCISRNVEGEKEVLEHGYIQIYTGDGKGKTTASLGLALRAIGHGWKVLIIQFTKGEQANNYYGEIASSSKLMPNLEVAQFGLDRVVYSDNINMEDYKEAKKGWQFTKEAINSGKYQLIKLTFAQISA